MSTFIQGNINSPQMRSLWRWNKRGFMCLANVAADSDKTRRSVGRYADMPHCYGILRQQTSEEMQNINSTQWTCDSRQSAHTLLQSKQPVWIEETFFCQFPCLSCSRGKLCEKWQVSWQGTESNSNQDLQLAVLLHSFIIIIIIIALLMEGALLTSKVNKASP